LSFGPGTSPEARYQRSPHVETSTVGDRVVLYHPERKIAVVLNPTGSWLWGILTGAETSSGLATLLRERFSEVSPEQALGDVSTLLTDLVGHGVVTVVE
jgi:hypothetical protein